MARRRAPARVTLATATVTVASAVRVWASAFRSSEYGEAGRVARRNRVFGRWGGLKGKLGLCAVFALCAKDAPAGLLPVSPLAAVLEGGAKSFFLIACALLEYVN